MILTRTWPGLLPLRQFAELLLHVCLGVFHIGVRAQAHSVNLLFGHLSLLDIGLDGLGLLLFIFVRLLLRSFLSLRIQVLRAMFNKAWRRLVAPPW